MREESGGGKIAAFIDEIRLPFRRHRHPAGRTARERRAPLPSLWTCRRSSRDPTGHCQGSWRAVPEGCSVPHRRGLCGAPGLAGQEGKGSAELLQHQRLPSRARSPQAELPEGTAQPRAERAAKEGAGSKYKGRANQPGGGKGSNQTSPNAAWQRWESSCSSRPGNG